MSSAHLGRRRFLTLPLALLLAPVAGARAAGDARRFAYECEVRALYSTLRYRLTGTIEERVDRAAGRYEVTLAGEGSGFANRGQSSGLIRDGWFVPLLSTSWVKIAGREGKAEISYDHERRVAHYRSRSETFFLGRLRVVDDMVALPPGTHVDDMVSALLNRAAGQWIPDASGDLRTRMVRRRRDGREGSEETYGEHRAELIPVVLTLAPGESGRTPTALFDLTRVSSWAVPDTPARIVFGADGWPQLITARLMYGTTFSIRLAPA